MNKGCVYIEVAHPKFSRLQEKVEKWHRINHTQMPQAPDSGFYFDLTTPIPDGDEWRYKYWIDLDKYAQNPFDYRLNKLIIPILCQL